MGSVISGRMSPAACIEAPNVPVARTHSVLPAMALKRLRDAADLAGGCGAMPASRVSRLGGITGAGSGGRFRGARYVGTPNRISAVYRS